MPPQQNYGPTAQHTSTAKQNSRKPSTLRNLNRRDRNYATEPDADTLLGSSVDFAYVSKVIVLMVHRLMFAREALLGNSFRHGKL